MCIEAVERAAGKTKYILRFIILLQFVVCVSRAVEQSGEVQTLELQAGELKVIVGNEADHGSKRTGYIGIWSLTSLHEPTNVFVPQCAGCIYLRERATVTRLGDGEAFIQHLDESRNVIAEQVVRVISPYYFDCEFRQKLASDSVDFLAASYINGPQDPGIYFLDAQMRWQRHYSPRHGEAASILPEGMAVPVVEKTPNSPYPQGIAHFWDSFSTSRYHPDYALFYGRFKKMVLVFMFRPRSNVIFFMSPSGRHAAGRANRESCVGLAHSLERIEAECERFYLGAWSLQAVQE